MERWLEFEVEYVQSTSRVVISLIEMTRQEDDRWPKDRTVGYEWFAVYPWWHSVRDVENAVAKLKTRLYNQYKKSAVFNTAVELVCDMNSGIKIPISDPQTDKLIAKFRENKKD